MSNSRWGKALAATGTRQRGQAIVEFAFASMVFLMIVFGTIDFGRAIFMSADLHNAAREGARYGKVNPADTSGIQTMVQDKSKLSNVTVNVSCTGSCKSGDTMTVTVSMPFQAVTQQLLGINPITLKSSAVVDIE
jgi:Flp pilus assembly protein TadG